MGKDEKTTAKVSTVLTPADKRKLQKVAHADRRKVSDYVRALILENIAKWELAQGGRDKAAK